MAPVQPPPLSSRLTRISTDPFTNPTSQHATEVEPDLFAFGSTLVAAFQAGRFFSAGASDIGFAASHDNGATWVQGFLPGITRITQPNDLFDSVSDPAVAYDAAHSMWLIASLPINLSSGLGAGVLVSRSADAVGWSDPVRIAPSDTAADKNWITCDNSPSSSFYGHCYVEWDDGGTSGQIFMATSSDGGATWTHILSPAGNPAGIGGQPLVQPGGTVIVPIADINIATILSFTSHDGGLSWSAPVTVAPIFSHFEAANFRSGPLPSAAMDASGKMYVVWEDCRFRMGCNTNDLVLSESADGANWTQPARIPIDAVTSAVDHFIPGIGINPATAGPNAHIALAYYYFANTNCSLDTCQLFAGFISSQDGGASWSASIALAGPMSVTWLAQTSLGRMVGDYIATAFAGGLPVSVFAVAHAPHAGVFDEAIYVPRPGLIALQSAQRHSLGTERPVKGVRSEYPFRRHPRRTP